jgi:hypothetical protein
LYRLYDAGISGQVYAVHESAAGFAAVIGGGDDVWPSDTGAAKIYAVFIEQGTGVAAASEEWKLDGHLKVAATKPEEQRRQRKWNRY